MSDKSRHGEESSGRKMTYKDAEKLTYFCEDMGFYFVMIIFVIGLCIRVWYI